MKTDALSHLGVYVEEKASDSVFQAYQILHWGFTIAPIIAGVDKFFDKLVNRTQYLWAPLGNLVGSSQRFMEIVGAIEIVAGFLVLFKPKIGGYVVAAWLAGIIINLLLVQNYYDIALRDLGLCLGALALGRLAMQFDHGRTSRRNLEACWRRGKLRGDDFCALKFRSRPTIIPAWPNSLHSLSTPARASAPYMDFRLSILHHLRCRTRASLHWG